jgi:hypothetical protein
VVAKKGNEYREKIADYRRLREATPAQQQRFTCDAFGIRWEELDEDFSFWGFITKPYFPTCHFPSLPSKLPLDLRIRN